MVMNAGRSIHGAPKHARDQAAHPILVVGGLVTHTLRLSADEIAAMPHRRFLDLDVDRETTFLPETDWSGVTLDELVEPAAPLAEANWARVSAGPYGFVVPRAQFAGTLLCDRIDGAPIPVEQGGPWRLVNPAARYNMSVKWVDRIELTAEEPDNSAERIAVARQRARDAKAAKGG
jgi:DMSO/TMAO reductase YedYZ molybdopterin-dependent catalytic subunit